MYNFFIKKVTCNNTENIFHILKVILANLPIHIPYALHTLYTCFLYLYENAIQHNSPTLPMTFNEHSSTSYFFTFSCSSFCDTLGPLINLQFLLQVMQLTVFCSSGHIISCFNKNATFGKFGCLRKIKILIQFEKSISQPNSF